MKKRRWPLWRDSWREWAEFRRAVEAGILRMDRRIDRLQAQNYRRHYSRAEEPWKLAEDRRLLRLHAKHSNKLQGLKLWVTIARELKRTTPAVQTRHTALLAGARLHGRKIKRMTDRQRKK